MREVIQYEKVKDVFREIRLILRAKGVEHKDVGKYLLHGIQEKQISITKLTSIIQ